MPDDDHEASKWSSGTSLELSLWVYNVDIKPGQFMLVLRLLQILVCNLAHTSLFAGMSCLFACCPYVSMGIVALWVNYWQLNNLKINFWWWLLQCTYVNFCSFSRVWMQGSLYPFCDFYWVQWQLKACLQCLLAFCVSHCVYDSFIYYLSYGKQGHIDTSQLRGILKV